MDGVDGKVASIFFFLSCFLVVSILVYGFVLVGIRGQWWFLCLVLGRGDEDGLGGDRGDGLWGYWMKEFY